MLLTMFRVQSSNEEENRHTCHDGSLALSRIAEAEENLSMTLIIGFINMQILLLNLRA